MTHADLLAEFVDHLVAEFGDRARAVAEGQYASARDEARGEWGAILEALSARAAA